MDKEKGKPVALYVSNPFKHDGRHYAEGEVLLDVEPEFAKELTGAGRTRLATAEDIAKSKKASKAAAA